MKDYERFLLQELNSTNESISFLLYNVQFCTDQTTRLQKQLEWQILEVNRILKMGEEEE